MLRRAATMIANGVQVIVLLALDDSGAPSYDRQNAAKLATMGAPCFTCTPGLLPELMATAIKRGNLDRCAAEAEIAHA
jgi:hypothetical protein